MKKKLLNSSFIIGAATISSLAMIAPAEALTFGNGSVSNITSADIGQAFTISFDGNVNTTSISGLAAEAVFTLQSFVNKTAVFNIDLKNTSTSGVTSRISRLGFDTDPNIDSFNSSVSGAFTVLEAGSFPNGFGSVEVCLEATSQGTCQGGPGGVLTGNTGSSQLTLAFSSALTSLALNNFGVRYQSITGVTQGTSGTGTGTPVVPTPVVPTPAAVLPALFGMGLAAVRRKAKGSEIAEEA